MLPMFTDDACCMAAARENEMCHARPCFLIKAPSPLPLIKGTVAEPHKQLLACMSSHLFDCLRVFRSLFCHLRCLIYYLCPRLLEITRCLNSSLPRAHPCTSARPRSRVCAPHLRVHVSPLRTSTPPPTRPSSCGASHVLRILLSLHPQVPKLDHGM